MLGAVFAASAAWTETPPAEQLFSSYAPLNVTLEAAFDDLRYQLRQSVTYSNVSVTDSTSGASISLSGTFSYTNPKAP